MKTFGEFLILKDEGVVSMDQANDNDDELMRALTIASQEYRQDVVSFLQRLAKQNTDIQIELDKLNHKEIQEKPSHKKMKIGSQFSHDLHDKGDVVTPNSADSSHGESP